MTATTQLEFPRGWRQSILGEVCQVVSGSTPKTSVDSYWGGDIPWITPNDLSKNRDKVVFGGERFITQAGYDSCSTQLVPAGSVLFTSRAPIGYVAIAGVSMCTNQGFKSAIPGPEVDGEFLYWQLQERTDSIRARASGTTFLEISGKGFAATSLVVPPLKEQAEIVRILEEQFSRLDAAAASVVALRRALDRCHASFLFNLLREPADAGLAARWRTVSVSEVVSDIRNGLSYKNDPTSGGLPIARIQTISSGRVNRDLVGFAGLASVDSKYLLEDGDILFSHINSLPHLGKVALFRANSGALVHGMNLLRLRVVPDVYPQFLHYAFCGDAVRMQVRARAQHAVNQASINIQSLKAIELPLPPYEEQMRIADAIETYETQVDKVSQTLAAVEKKMGNLRRALLRAAFSGELTKEWREKNNG